MEKRRRQNQERNRTAASRCRQRKKQWQDGLERRRIELESRRKALHLETEELLEEVDHLKNFVMAHAACNDAKIDNWISNEADSFVRRISTANLHGQQPQPGLGDAESPLQNTSTGRPSMNGTFLHTCPIKYSCRNGNFANWVCIFDRSHVKYVSPARTKRSVSSQRSRWRRN